MTPNPNSALKTYFWKIALPVVLVTLIVENAFTQDTMLGMRLSYIVHAGSGQKFLDARGGLREGQRGRAYYDSVSFPIYEGEEGKNIPLKEFMVNHITHYEPAILLGLADDWKALEQWDLSSDLGEQTIKDGFADELVQVLSFKAATYSHFWKSSSIDYKEMSEVLADMKNQRDYSKIYKSRSTRPVSQGMQKFVVLDQTIPESLQDHLIEPNVTSQLLDLQRTTMTMFSKKSQSVTQRVKEDMLVCTVSGSIEFAVTSPWEYTRMRVGKEFAEGGYLPNNFSPLDLFHEENLTVKVHLVTLGPGDCLFVPSHWWYQSLSSKDGESISVTHWYESSSTWADAIFEGISDNKL